MGAAQMNST